MYTGIMIALQHTVNDLFIRLAICLPYQRKETHKHEQGAFNNIIDAKIINDK